MKKPDDIKTGEAIALLLLLIGPAIFAGQVVYWLIHRDWYPLPVSRVLDLLNIPVAEFDRDSDKIEMVLGAPLSVVLFVLAIVVALTVFDTSGNKEASDKAKSDV